QGMQQQGRGTNQGYGGPTNGQNINQYPQGQVSGQGRPTFSGRPSTPPQQPSSQGSTNSQSSNNQSSSNNGQRLPTRSGESPDYRVGALPKADAPGATSSSTRSRGVTVSNAAEPSDDQRTLGG